MDRHIQYISTELGIRPEQAAAVVALLDDGNTIPFIARYRKEATGSLDEEQLRQIAAQTTRLRTLDERRAVILASITEQGQLTPELQAQIDTAGTATLLEDLYAPYRPKRRTRAGIARERGLQPLAELILAQPIAGPTVDELAAGYLGPEVGTVTEALAGARDIVAETISDHAVVRQRLRERALKTGTLQSRRVSDAVDERGVYQLYYEFDLPLPRLRPHQVLAINRAEAEKALRVSIDIPETEWLLAIRAFFRPDRHSRLADQLQLAMDDAAQRLLLPAVERDIRRILTEQAEAHAIQVFARNLRALLGQPPFAGHTVLGIDPGFRTGCKAAVMDPTGRVLATTTIYPHPPQNKTAEAREKLLALVTAHQISLIAIGNGTASRETEQLVAEITRQREGLHYLIVNEAGASVYSASKLARAELPELDVSMRGAVSIGRRLQDPLAELVKIDPQSIGVGLYQHDVDQKRLTSALADVVESVVNQVGVDVNSASPALLGYVAGIGPKLSEQIVAHRDTNGPFTSRQALRQVSGLGVKAFEQAAGFLRVRDGDNPLDASAIHPESYAIASAVLNRAGLSPAVPSHERVVALDKLRETVTLSRLATELGSGEPTLADIFEQLARPGRDPREDIPRPILRSDILSMDDLSPGLRLTGTVRNVVDFGAFVDIGVKQDGLLHKRNMPPGTVLQVGDIIEVCIALVDKDRGRIGLAWSDEMERE
jgi:uncharacterized protein